MAKKGLGKGLSALIPQVSSPADDGEIVTEIMVGSVSPNPYQPRRVFAPDKLAELAASIKEHGIVQPIVVRQMPGGKHELVVGERRWRACQLLGWEKMPAVLKEYTNEQIMEIALVENIQRQDLNPVEEAQAYKKLISDFGYTQEQVARKVAKSRPYIANMVRLLNLPESVLTQVAQGELSVGHVRPLLTVGSSALQVKAAGEMRERKMTVREAEELARHLGGGKQGQKGQKIKTFPREKRRSPELVDLEAQLREKWGTKVTITPQGSRGKIEIEYYSLEDLNRLFALFCPH